MDIKYFGDVKVGKQVFMTPGATYIEKKIEAGATYTEFGLAEGNEPQAPQPSLQEEEKKIMTEDKLRMFIENMAEEFKQQNHWFAIYKPLVWAGAIENGDYDGGVKYIHDLFKNCPEEQRLKVFAKDFTAEDLRKMDQSSLSRPLEKWKEDDAPVTGARFFMLQTFTKAFEKVISNYQFTK